MYITYILRLHVLRGAAAWLAATLNKGRPHLHISTEGRDRYISHAVGANDQYRKTA